jgi:hypothetical protein
MKGKYAQYRKTVGADRDATFVNWAIGALKGA